VLTSPLLFFGAFFAFRNWRFKRVAKELGLKCEIYGKWLQDQDLGEVRVLRSIFGHYRGKEIKISDVDARPDLSWKFLGLNVLLRSGLPTGVRDRMRRSTIYFIDGVEINKQQSGGRSSVSAIRRWLDSL
jgi:hypothetical protein